jgi:hypothetical protein
MKALDEGLRREGNRAVLPWRRDCARRSGVIPKAVEFAAYCAKWPAQTPEYLRS